MRDNIALTKQFDYLSVYWKNFILVCFLQILDYADAVNVDLEALQQRIFGEHIQVIFCAKRQKSNKSDGIF